MNSFDVPGVGTITVPLAYYYVTLQTARTPAEVAALGAGTSSTGSMTITFNSNAGGIVNSSLYVWFDVHEGSLTGPIIMSGETPAIGYMGSSWTSNPPPGTELINGVDHYLLGPGNVNGDFWIDTATGVHTGPHSVTIAQEPPSQAHGSCC